MGKIYLCGHTGSANRGCHAILRSTAHLLEQYGAGKPYAMTFRQDQDVRFSLDKHLELIPYPQKPQPLRFASLLMRVIAKNGVWGNRYAYRGLFRRVTGEDLIFNVGGDTYCYDPPYLSYALNEMAQEHGVPTVFWGCSVDERLLNDRQMQQDINRYRWIVVRESLSRELLRRCVKDESRILQICDPAFHLPTRPTALPEGFVPGNTVGLNLSPLMFSDPADSNDPVYRSVQCLMDHILETTDMRICLIPHVYDPAANTQDIQVLRLLHSQYQSEPRVCIVEEDLDSTALKYIISQCRFFVGARTHATIAAYSTAVPAIALSYSTKSLGIAQDLLGTHQGYTLKRKELTQPTRLRDTFIEILMSNEQQLRTHYDRVLPPYKQSIFTALDAILGKDGSAL